MSNNSFTTSPGTTTSTYIGWPSYPNYTYGSAFMFAELTERQMTDLESRMQQIVRKEIAHTLSLLLSALSDGDEGEEGE